MNDVPDGLSFWKMYFAKLFVFRSEMHGDADVLPTPATHSILTVLNAAETVY